MNKILHIVGTRPQYIKLFPLWEEISSKNLYIQSIYDTGQHYDKEMSQAIIEEFGFTDIFFGDVKGLSPSKQIPKMISNIWEMLEKEEPEYVFIYGDTNSTLAAAIACAKSNIPFGHIEAGVRTKKHIGIQEGINRKVADTLAIHNFCVTKIDYNNLLQDGLSENTVFHVGDLMYDAFHLISKNIQSKEMTDTKESVLVTVHRAENIDNDKLKKKILETVKNISKSYYVVFPMHPRMLNSLSEEEKSLLEDKNINVCKPLVYSSIVSLLNNVRGVVTDSGGLPKDAAFAGVKSVVLRDDPVWQELYDLEYIQTTPNIENLSSLEISNHIIDSFKVKQKPFKQDFAVTKILDVVENNFSKGM